MTFDMVKVRGGWMPIRDCRGRFVLRDAPPTFNVADLLGDGIDAQQLQPSRAKDVVWVVCLEDGGTISYRRPTGTWLHTLNTKEGFRRKLEQLEISLHEFDNQKGVT